MSYSMQLQFILALSFAETTEIRSSTALRFKRAPEEKFKTLLHLYRMNPLKHSSVYERLFNRLMLPHKTTEANYDAAMNFDSNESTKEKQRNVKVKLKHIEKTIHAKPVSIKNEDIAYNLTNVRTENFSSETFLHRHKRPRHFSAESDFLKVSPNVDLLFGHIDTDSEDDNKVILTKIRPANRTLNNQLVLNSITDQNTILDDVLLFKTVPRIPIAANFVQYTIGNFSDIEAMVLN